MSGREPTNKSIRDSNVSLYGTSKLFLFSYQLIFNPLSSWFLCHLLFQTFPQLSTRIVSGTKHFLAKRHTISMPMILLETPRSFCFILVQKWLLYPQAPAGSYKKWKIVHVYGNNMQILLLAFDMYTKVASAPSHCELVTEKVDHFLVQLPRCVHQAT